MATYSRPVGTNARFRDQLAEWAMSDLALDFKSPSSAKRKLEFAPQCCFVTTLGRRCAMDATDRSINPMCTLHRRRCNTYLKSYQKECKGDNDTWKSANKIVRLIFGSVEGAMQYIESHEQTLCTTRYTPISMNELEEVQQDLHATYRNTLSSKNRDFILSEANVNYERIRNCWLGRHLYRKSCECVPDEGHVAAYYIYKAAVLVLNFVRNQP